MSLHGGLKITGKISPRPHRRYRSRISDVASSVVQSGYETAAEDFLIHLFKPIWNSETAILYGLGKHGDAAETPANKRSPWDTLHPGREWAAKTKEDARSKAQIASDLKKHFAEARVYKNLNQVLQEFLNELRQI